jgi:hypothetical protein
MWSAAVRVNTVASVNPPATPMIRALRSAGATRLNGSCVALLVGVI